MVGKNMKHAKLILFFALVLVLSITSTNTSDNVVTDNFDSKGFNSPAIEFKVSYEDHSKITIDGDTAFETQAGIEEWDGAGTELSPYLIQGYNFSDPAGGISISDVSLYFEIKDCLITYPTFQNRVNGMYLSNVTHVNVVNCTINNFSHGLSVYGSSGSTIENCTVFGATYYGIYFNGVNYSAVVDCTVYDMMTEGIAFHSSRHCNITNNQVYDTGADAIYVQEESDFLTIDGNTLYDNAGAGIYLWNSDNCTIQNNIAHDNSYEGEHCGIDLTSSANCTVIDNEFYDNVFAGVNLYNSPNCDIVSNAIYNNSDHGIYGVLSENCTIINNDIYENGFWGESLPTCGISFGETERWHIEGNNIWNNSANGIFVNDAQDTTIKDNVIFNNTNHGITGYWAFNVTVIGNTIYGNGRDYTPVPSCGVYLYQSDDWVIDSNTIYNNTDNGIYLDNSHYNNITNNEIYDNALDGIRGFSSQYYNVSANTIYDNVEDGLFLSGVSNWTVTHNIVYDNDQYGINLAFSADCWVYYNDIGWNAENAYDGGNPGDNQWDDNVSVGNWWHDWESGNYTVAGAHHINDTHAAKNMYVYNATEIECEAGTEEIMTWTAYALNPDSYEFYVDDILFDSDTWDGSDIDIDVTGIDTGFHEVILEVYHVSGHSLNGTSNVTVSDTQPPTWDTTPSNPITVEFGTHLSYDADASDPNGLDKWWLNDTSFSIDSNGVITNATALAVGDYGLIISVNDTLGHILSIEITVQVRDTIDPVWDTLPQNQEVEFGDIFSYQLSASDLSGIASWSMNNTSFALDSNGLLTNTTSLAVGDYALLITIIDNEGNMQTAEIVVQVEDTTSPIWVWGETPQDQLVEFNAGLSLQLYVYDLSAIGDWSVNDTANFAIDSNGLLTNVTALESGTYGLLISVEDIYGNPLSIEISITIGESPVTTTTTPTTTPTGTTDPPTDPVLFLVLGGGGAVLVVVIVLIGVSKKRGG